MLIIQTKDARIEALKEIRHLNPDKLYIWGDGVYGQSIREYIRTVGGYTGTMIAIVDDVFYHSGKPDTLSFSEYLKLNDRETPVVFGIYNYPVVQQKRAEWNAVIHHLFDFHLTYVNGRTLLWNGSAAKSRENEYRKTYDLLGDDHSRHVMQLYLNTATAGEFRKLFTECYEAPAYFNRYTERLNIDTLIDCGAFDGDSIHDFTSAHPEYRRIIAIEPDPQNVHRLREREKQEGIHSLAVIPKGLGAQRGMLRFRANGASNSFLNEEGDMEVEITTLDGILAETEGEVGQILLKMDIEGAELDALHGAEKLLREKKPAMAISVYHRETDLIDLPRFIHDTVGESAYDYYLGFHGLDLAELVLYAIPRTECAK